MIPSRKEMMAYWFEHPIAGTFIAFGVAEAVKTIWESLVNPKGMSPFSSYTDIRSGDVLDNLGTLQEDFAKLQADHNKAIEHHDKYHYEHHKNIKEETLGHLTRKQKQELEEVSEQLTKASGMHAEQARQLTAASKMHAGQAKKIKQLGSTSTTTSTSSAHGGTPKVPTGSTWDKHSGPGDKLEMFGGHKMKGSVLMGPPSMRRRISLNSITLGGMHKAPQKINTEKEELPVSSHFGLLGMMPEQSEDATDNPWV